jgi:4-hydroxy-tetrahydrodipicolinate synthase
MTFIPYGITPPIVTPFHPDGSVNYEMLGKLSRHLVENGVHGLFPLGTSGEFYAIEGEDYVRILKTVRDAVSDMTTDKGKKIQLFAGCSSIATRNVIRMVHQVEELGGYDAVSILTPMFVSQSDEELYEFYASIARSTDMPIILYNNKSKTNITIKPEVVSRLAHDFDNIVAVKDSTGDMTNCEEYLRLTMDIRNKFNVIMGKDTMIFAALMYGASGAIASTANVAPRIAADIYDKWAEGDYDGAREAQYKLAPLRIAANQGTFPEAIKEGLMMEGFAVGKCLDPIQEATPAQKENLRSVLINMGLIEK